MAQSPRCDPHSSYKQLHILSRSQAAETYKAVLLERSGIIRFERAHEVSFRRPFRVRWARA